MKGSQVTQGRYAKGYMKYSSYKNGFQRKRERALRKSLREGSQSQGTYKVGLIDFLLMLLGFSKFS